MGTYREFQFATVLVITLGLTEIFLGYLFTNDIGTKPMDLTIFLMVSALLVISVLLFYGMTTRVNHEKIIVSFGIGLIRKSVNFSVIQEVNIVMSAWYFGWGIRYIPNGMLYNVSGPDAVELKLKSGTRVVRIGTKDPVRLHSELIARLRDRDN